MNARLQVVVIAVLLGGAPRGTLAEQKKTAWSPPRTVWGDPDLRGTWTNETITPFERPPAMAAKPFLTAAEAAALEASSSAQRRANDGASQTATSAATTSSGRTRGPWSFRRCNPRSS